MPHCGEKVQILTRNKRKDVTTHFAIIQPIDSEMSVVRILQHIFNAELRAESRLQSRKT